MLMVESTLLTMEEAAKLLRVSVATIRRMIIAGDLDGHKVGRQWRIRRESLQKFL